mmetsp:Transcript_677/g.1780  ORF Transcript_677/g.1780 Transcript_677/m.1780 type:complete len:219 (+) Transcript_677:65-721(+)
MLVCCLFNTLFKERHHSPGMGKARANSLTSALRASISGKLCDLTKALKSLSLPSPGVLALRSTAIWMPLWTRSATFSKSSSTKPRVVSAGAPILMPPGTMALLSPGTEFLFSVIWHRSKMVSTLAPSTPFGFRSTSTRWFSVPPETREYPSCDRRCAKAAAFETTCSWYFLNSGCAACFSAKARAPMAWLWGPPWRPGKTAELIFLSRLTPWTSWPRL